MLGTDVIVPKVNRASRCRRDYGLVPRGWLWIRKRFRHGFIVSLGADVTDCLGGRKRRCRKLRSRRSAWTAACLSVTVDYTGLLSDRARCGYDIAPYWMTAAPCRGWPASGPGGLLPGPWFLAGGAQRLRRPSVNADHFRRSSPLSSTGSVYRMRRTARSPDGS